jgi:hypothetical protein
MIGHLDPSLATLDDVRYPESRRSVARLACRLYATFLRFEGRRRAIPFPPQVDVGIVDTTLC